MKMKKILATLFLAILFQGVAETVVKGIYDTKKKRYTELSQTFEKEINLSYVLPNDKKDTVTYKTENYDILVRKSDLLELYNRKREKKENNIKDNISDKDKKLDYVRNYIAELVENNRAVIYERKTKKEIKKLPEEILRFKNYSEYRGIKYYIFKSQDEILKAFVGVYWGTTGRTNDYYMQQIIKDPEIKKKTRKIEVSMKELLKK